MKTGFAFLILCAGLSLAARAEDMITLTGQTYSNIVVQQYDQQKLVILHDSGRTEVPFQEISPELRGHYKALSSIPISTAKRFGEKAEPAGPNDLATLSGQIYRNVILKRVDADRILIAHDTGMDTVYFAAMPLALQKKFRTETPVVPDPPTGPNDIVTTYDQVFRNTRILQTEPDGLTFSHDGGVTKLGFPALPEEVREKYAYDPIAAWKYQREMNAKRGQKQQPPEATVEVPTGPATVLVSKIETEKLPDNKFWVRFSLQNPTDQPQSAHVVPCTEQMIPIVAGKTINIPAQSTAELQQVTVNDLAPTYLKVSSGTYWTNCLLSW